MLNNALTALTETAATTAEMDTTGSIIYMVGSIAVLLIVFYFFMVRPQKKKDKEAKELRDSLQIGDEVTTIGGITGIIVRINRNSQNSREDSAVIETGGDRSKIRVKLWAISENSTVHDAVEEAPKTAVKAKKDKQADKPADKQSDEEAAKDSDK
jgi:preprotein translocase subunit YajC